MRKRRTIGMLAKQAGVGIETVRFYERKGLIERPRTGDGYRDYDDVALARLRYIKIAQRMGFSLADVARLGARLGDGPGFCEAVRETARKRLGRIAGEIAELRRLETELGDFLARCGRRPADQPCEILLELTRFDQLIPQKTDSGA